MPPGPASRSPARPACARFPALRRAHAGAEHRGASGQWVISRRRAQLRYPPVYAAPLTSRRAAGQGPVGASTLPGNPPDWSPRRVRPARARRRRRRSDRYPGARARRPVQSHARQPSPAHLECAVHYLPCPNRSGPGCSVSGLSKTSGAQRHRLSSGARHGKSTQR
ncbi:Uncharacterised protein [Mycobacteroides abscessus subsp. abscessus]|nr:Uncharacterised protein [Mycobacteroides abscessus subsp. abscessus]